MIVVASSLPKCIKLHLIVFLSTHRVHTFHARWALFLVLSAPTFGVSALRKLDVFGNAWLDSMRFLAFPMPGLATDMYSAIHLQCFWREHQ